jgi:hypothetical protein
VPRRNRVDPWGDLHAIASRGLLTCRLVVADRLLRFSFDGWRDATPRPVAGEATVLTPPTSVAALAHGYRPVLHPSARPG